MDILKAATDWAKDELISTPFFILAGTLFLAISLGLWQVGKTDLARAYIVPMLVAGSLLTIIGLGLFFTNKARIDQFKIDHSENPIAFVEAELARTNATLLEYKNVVFTGIPVIIGICVGILFFVSAPRWRATIITSISMLSVILFIDGLAHARISEYRQQLLQEQKEIQHNKGAEESF